MLQLALKMYIFLACTKKGLGKEKKNIKKGAIISIVLLQIIFSPKETHEFIKACRCVCVKCVCA